MFHTWKFKFLIVVSVMLLAGCSQSPGEKATDAIKAAERAFYANDKDRTEEIDGIKLYKPAGFVVSESSDAQNIVFNKNKEIFTLFANPNEAKNSRLFYDLLLADQNKKILAIDTFTESGAFGFAAIVQSDSANVELIASVGGAKMTTLSKDNQITGQLDKMMNVVRSIE